MNQIEIQNHPDFDGHEWVEFVSNDKLSAIIAVHNSNLGPAVGGCRMFPYATHQDAMTDVLRLSKGMTYKSALAGLPLGGGKSVILGDPRKDKSREMLLAMGEFIESLKGRYVTAEDSGTTVADMATIGENTRYVSGVVKSDKYGGDPSPYTAYGVMAGIREAVLYRCQSGLEDIRVAIQGVGNVGYHLARMLIEAGAKVVVADVNESNLARAALLGVDVLPSDEILSAEVDVLAPCAMGSVISQQTVRGIRAGIVAGAANNQLAAPEMGSVMMDRGILYAPDYVINAGGIIDVFYQRKGAENNDAAIRHIDSIGTTLRTIFTSSDEQRRATHIIADEMAEQVFKSAGDQAA